MSSVLVISINQNKLERKEMGQSTDAILAFGYDLGDELPFSEEIQEKEDFDEEWELVNRIVGWNETWSKSNGGYFERLEKAKGNSGVEFIWHCSDEYPMYLLAAIGSEMRASRGDPVEVANLDINPIWIENLEKAAKILGIEGKPSWWLVSNWA